jgi:hypothetical protein
VQVIALDSELMITDSRFREESAEVLRALLSAGRGRYRWQVLAAHHPLRTYGVHDGAGWPAALLKFCSLFFFPSHVFAALEVPPFSDLNQEAYSLRYAAYRRAVERAVQRSGAAVSLFLAGHDHQLQLLSPAAAGQPLVLISGAAARCNVVSQGRQTIFAAPKNGFAVVTAYPHQLVLDFFGTSGCDQATACAPAADSRPHHLYGYAVARPG